MDTSLEELRAGIEREVPFAGEAFSFRRVHSRNVIELILDQIAKDFGADEADRVIENFDLEELGWRVKRKK